MFDFSFSELALVFVVALVVIGPKELPMAMRAVGRWLGKLKRMTAGIRGAFDDMMQEAGVDEVKETLSKDKKYITDLEGKMQEVYDISDFLKHEAKPTVTTPHAPTESK